MPLLKLNRINKGGEILINSEHILFIEIESKATTVHMTRSSLFSVEESPASIAEKDRSGAHRPNRERHSAKRVDRQGIDRPGSPDVATVQFAVKRRVADPGVLSTA